MRAIPFLSTVWKYVCEDGDYVFLSTKSVSGGNWKDHAIRFNRKTIRSKLRTWLQKHSSDKYDIYFCPLPFSGKSRRKNLVRHANILWSDIDSGNPHKIKPTFLWESSPGRLQGIWLMEEEPVPAEEAAELNKALAYYLGADKGGWDLTQVLRVPGTKNHKYESQPTVRVLEHDRNRVYQYRRIAKRVGLGKPKEEEFQANDRTTNQILSKYKRRIPSKVKRLLFSSNAQKGKRSDIIWYLENKLSEAGLTPEEIITLIKNSAWNKYRGRSDEDVRLRTELEKIIETSVSTPDEEQVEEEADEELSSSLVIESHSDLMSSLSSSPGWLIESFWMKKSHGIIAGEPKSFKSTLALDLSVAIASGRDFLGKYPVHNSGPVIYIQNENARWIMKDRIGKICSSKGLVGSSRYRGRRIEVEWAPEIPLFSINQQNFLISDPIHQKLAEQILESYRPEAIIFDPFYLMFDGDINSQKELYPVLDWLIEMRVRYNCAVILVHHWNKGGKDDKRRGGQRMLGSTTLHGWIESAWYVSSGPEESGEEEDGVKAHSTVTIEREFRGAGIHPRLDVEIAMGDIGTGEYKTSVEIHHKKEKKDNADDQEEQVLGMIKKYKLGMSLEQIHKFTGISKNRLSEIIDTLTEKGYAKRHKRKVLFTR